jgi:hypothetical protein
MGEYLVMGRIHMKRLGSLAAVAIAFGLVAAGTAAYSQATFKIPFKFEAGGKKFSQGEYWVAQKGEKQIAFRMEPNGEEILIPFIQKLEQAKPPVQEPQLVFDLVGNFEPSYTEYVTDYLLAEVWLSVEEGFLIHTTKGAHQSQTVKGQKVQK